MGLSDSERISMIRSAVLIQYTRVTDGQTDGIGVAYTRYSIYAVARKNQAPDTVKDVEYKFLLNLYYLDVPLSNFLCPRHRSLRYKCNGFREIPKFVQFRLYNH